jgi:glycosyltransferase involved in cell wall biosynthesis
MSRPERVLLLGDSLRPGGTEGQFVEVASGLGRAGWDVDVACMRAEGSLRGRLDGEGIRPWSYGPASTRAPHLARAILGLARHMRAGRVALVHCFDFYSNILGVPAARLARVPVVIASQRDLGNLRSPSQQRWQRGVLRLAHATVVNSPSIAEILTRNGSLASERIQFIPNGVDLERFHAVPGGHRPEGPPMVMTLGNLRPEKGLEDFVRAAQLVHARMPEVAFAICGDGPLRAALESLVGQLGLRDVVVLQGATATPETALWSGTILVHPSLSEASSNVVLEAMASGLPVVATRVGGLPWLIADEVSGLLVPPSDPAALAKAIMRLLESPGLAAELGGWAARRAREQFSMSAMLRRVEALYSDLLDRRRGAR